MQHRLKRSVVILFYCQLLIALPFILNSCTFSRYAKRSYEKATLEKPYDVIIVPGVPYGQNNMEKVMTMRIYWAKLLYDSGYAKNIIFSGSAVATPYFEGIVMKIIADSMGILSKNTFAETGAEHSTENIYYSWKMAKRMGYSKIAFATDPFQSRLVKKFVGKFCPEVQSIPIVFDMLNMENQKLPVIDFSSAYSSGFVPLKKRENFWQRLRGSFGRKVEDEIAREQRESTVAQTAASN